MKPRVTRKQKTLLQIENRIENLEKIVVSVLLRLEKLDGVDSSKSEKENVKKISRKIYRAISLVSPLDGYILEAHMNEKDLTSTIKQ